MTATIPWDSYLIRNNIWSYPDDAVLGPTIFRIPYEEVFFFVIQTYNTSLLYCLLSKPTFHPVYLYGGKEDKRLRPWVTVGGLLIAGAVALGAWAIKYQGEGTYLGLILVWAGPFCLLLWLLAY